MLPRVASRPCLVRTPRTPRAQVYRQSLLEAEKGALRASLDRAVSELEEERRRRRANIPPAAQPSVSDGWDAHAAAVQNVLGAVPLDRPGGAPPALPDASSSSSSSSVLGEWASVAKALTFTDIVGALAWIDARLRACVVASFPCLERLLSTPLLCRERDEERASDLLAKRDSLLLMRDGALGTSLATVPTLATTLGSELRKEEHSSAVQLASLSSELASEEAQRRHLEACVEAQARSAADLLSQARTRMHTTRL